MTSTEDHDSRQITVWTVMLATGGRTKVTSSQSPESQGCTFGYMYKRVFIDIREHLLTKHIENEMK